MIDKKETTLLRSLSPEDDLAPAHKEVDIEQLSPNTAPVKPVKTRGKFVMPKWAKTTLMILVPILVVFGLLGVYGAIKAQALMAKGRELQVAGQAAYDALKAQNLPETDAKLNEVDAKFVELRKEYDSMGWVKFVPIASAYYNDGVHGLNAGEAGIAAGRTAVKAIEPYADVLGFAGEGTFTGGSVENRVKLALDTLSKIEPVMDELTANLEKMDSELSMINEKRYPEEFGGKQIRSKIVLAKEVASGAKQTVVEGRPVLKVLPRVAGSEGRKKYLIVFQNNNELRATGGFMTAYATLFVENGVVTPEKSDDIYELDKKFKNKPEAPAILLKYLKTETRWNLRDMNMSPDVKNSMDVFWSYFSKLPGEAKDIDGIIMMDTQVLSSLVGLLGPVEVPGYGTFSAETDKRCDCPQIIYALSEIIDRPTPYLRENRKGIIGPMMQGVLAKAYGAPKQQWPDLFKTGWKNIEEKHIQFYFLDPEVQAAAEAIDAAGRVNPTPEGSDYFMLVDTNLGGAKSNLFVESEMEQDVNLPADGKLEKTVTITYKNPHAGSNCNLEAGQLCLNGKLTDWVRIYLPLGTELGETLGFDDSSVKTYEELGHTVVEGVFTLEPLNQAKIKLTYKVPYTDATNYKLQIQKQGGSKDMKAIMIVNGGEHELLIDKDQAVTLPF